MTDNSKKLNDIYREAKRNRIVLTQDEFALKLGFKSRVHLFGRLMKSNEGISDQLLIKAKRLINNTTENVSHEILNNHVLEEPPARYLTKIEIENEFLREEIRKNKKDFDDFKRETTIVLEEKNKQIGALEERLKNFDPLRKISTAG